VLEQSLAADGAIVCFSSNLVPSADQQYEGKELLVTGKVESIDTVFGSTSVTLKGKEMSIVSVQCFVDDSQKGAVAKLKKGTLATVQGSCDGKSLNVELKNCVIR
jgi:putative nucleic acid binding protein